MPKSVCVKCEVELFPERNGVIVAELCNNNKDLYKLWEADLWKCPECGIEVVLGFAQHPFRQSHDEDISKVLQGIAEDGGKIIYDKERFGE